MKPDLLRRHPGNPVLAAADLPYAAALVFNAGVCKFAGKYVMVFRNDYGDFRNATGNHGTNLGMATSDDGVRWDVSPANVFTQQGEDAKRNYDPRLTVLDGRVYMCFAQDTHHGIRGGVAVTDDFQSWEVLSLSAPDNRNMVLFPEKIAGKFARFERPMPTYGNPREGHAFDVWFADSPDARYWGNQHLVMGREAMPNCNDKIGPGAPPIRTDRGWLALIHVVYKDDAKPLKGWERGPWTKTYAAGAMLTDLREPWRVIGYSREPVFYPTADYETDGFRGSVIFPGGLIDEGDGTAKVYYGGADTVECLATADIDDLVAACEPT